MPRSTYYHALWRKRQPDKYAKLKEFIKKEFKNSFETYGYRRIASQARRAGFKCSPNTINRLMGELGLTVTVYSRHISGYHSYKGNTGTVVDNVLKQKFDATEPYTVLHTDVTQVKLANNQWGYISAVIDEASNEVVSLNVSNHANKQQLATTLSNLQATIPKESMPILHSDQGWQYQLSYYHQTLHKMGIIPSMSRKGNCHDNAPIESFFNLLKRERLNRSKIEDLDRLEEITSQYVKWFNEERISLNKNGLTPIEYRNQAIA